ncbi:major intrinsically disordered Notch2-binding receptor 1 [Xenopus laevis]|uniref:Major intrinsically disordered Notch2-binding receptor 1-like C-terminal domain-containing protein n=2 Tax=Xenopus laevis TaxID=8355 RepID=A0A974D7R0_XENLA|nr:major intrinsically disordered Notch2-binding receptor 1 [Xenopus laevis]OCT86707.1 hypothetical protein XELAEV_18020396mg [Xenopus laevis]
MGEAQDSSFLLVKILEDLDSKQNSVSYQDLCKSLCARYDLPELAKLRSLLYYTACQDPSFPASLFRDKMRNAAENQQSKKIIAAADIVTIFNLIQMNEGVAKDKLPIQQQSNQKETIESDTDGYSGTDIAPHKETQNTSRSYSITRTSSCHKEEREGRRTFLPEPNFLLGVKKDANVRAGSLDRLQTIDSYPMVTPQSCEMQSTYFPSQPLSEPESLPPTPNEEPFRLSSTSGKRRNIFKDDFHNMRISPTLKKSEGKISPKTVFFNHSFEMPYSSHYLNTVYSSTEDFRRAKHESLDDLQASTYFGPSSGPGSQDLKKISNKPKQVTTKPVKSWSLNNEEVPDFERSFFNRKETNFCYPSTALVQSSSFVSGPERHHSFIPELGLKANGKKFCEPPDVEKQESMRRFREKNTKLPACQFSVDKTESVGTQTEQSEVKKGKETVPANCGRYTEGRARNQSEADSEIISDDISDIFRFLDDMSLCGSSGIPQSSCYNSSGSLVQIPRLEPESSPEHGPNRASKPTKGPRTETGEEEGLKSSVRKLVRRIGEIEKKLESLSGVRDEVSQVLAKLNTLDERIQPPPDKIKGESESLSHNSDVINSTRASPCSFHDQNTHNANGESKPECCCSDINNTSESLRVKALKKNLYNQRTVRSLSEEISSSEPKIGSASHDCRSWAFPKQTSISEEDKKDKGAQNSRDWHRKSKEVDRQHEIPHLHRMPKSHKESFMVEQVFSPHPYPASLKSHMKSNPIYTDMRLTEMTEVKRTQPSWTIEEYAHNSGEKGRLTALDLQGQESLNPNNLEFWMEDIYTPGYDSLIKRKEAEFRRAKVCKMAALITAAACTVILVIVVPICTMKS